MTARDPLFVKLQEDRETILQIQAHTLSFGAHKIMRDWGVSVDQFALFCVDLASKHRDIAKMHNPDIVLPKTFAEGTFSVYQGAAEITSLCKMLFPRLPDLEFLLDDTPQNGLVKCFILNDGGCSVYGIKPIPLS